MPIVRSQSAIVRPNQEMLAGPTEKGHFFNIKHQRNVLSIKPEFDNKLFNFHVSWLGHFPATG